VATCLEQLSLEYYNAVAQSCRVYQTRVHDIDELRQRLITVWCGLEQRAVNDVIDQWQRRLLACVDA